MKRILCPELPAPGKSVELPEQEANHALRVLRLRDGDLVEALDGRGRAVIAVLRYKGTGIPRLEFQEEVAGTSPASPPHPEPVPLVLEMGILKGDAMEWVVEKAVELGVQSLVPTITAHTVVQLQQKGPEAFQARWQKIADQALKQCGRLDRMEIQFPVTLESLLLKSPATEATPRLWCDEVAKDSAMSLQKWLKNPPSSFSQARLLIGPEGGWSGAERELLSRGDPRTTFGISLGPWILRAETAALFGVSLLSAHFRG